MFDLHGRVAVVTGASAGLGRQFALALARQGADLAILARREWKLNEVAEEILSLIHILAVVEIGRAENLLALLVRLGVAEGVLLDAVYHRGLDAAGADVVAVYAVGAELEGDALGHARAGVLAGAVGAHSGAGGIAAVGGDDHDGALALLYHVGGRVLAGVDDAEHVDAVDLHVGLVGAVLDELVLALVTGVGYDNVDGAEGGVGAVDKGLDLVLVRDVGNEGCLLYTSRCV